MAIGAAGTILRAEDIAVLAATVRTSAGELGAASDALRSRVTRAGEFEGTAAQNYDAFLQEWATHQRNMITAMEGAADLLQRLSENTEALSNSAFNL